MNKKTTGSRLAELEKDKSYKRRQIPFSYQWMSWLYVGPILLLFMSLFSILYLLKGHNLVNWYVIPYLIVFVVATIWLKAVRKYINDKLLNNPEAFITAFAKPVLTDKYKVYSLFSAGANRHNPTYIEHQASQVSSSYADLIPQMKPGQALPLFADDENNSDDLYLCCLRKFSVRKNNIGWNEQDSFPVLLINKKIVKSIS